MSFWSEEFMNDRRQQWLNSLVKFQYRVGEESEDSWHDAKITTKRVVGDRVEVIASFPRVESGSQNVTGVRIIDVKGKVAGFQETEIVRMPLQGLLTKFEFPIYEKEREEE